MATKAKKAAPAEEIKTEVMKPVEVVTAVRFEVVDKLVMADPCYIDKDDAKSKYDCLTGPRPLGKQWDNASGIWTAGITMLDNSQTHGWGDRVKELELVKDGAKPHHSLDRLWDHCADNGVDSGQMWVGCRSSLPLNYEALLQVYDPTYKEDAPLSGHDNWVHKDFFAFNGAVSQTGYGDGLYPVFEAYVGGELVAVKIDFIPDEDYDEEDEGW